MSSEEEDEEWLPNESSDQNSSSEENNESDQDKSTNTTKSKKAPKTQVIEHPQCKVAFHGGTRYFCIPYDALCDRYKKSIESTFRNVMKKKSDKIRCSVSVEVPWYAYQALFGYEQQWVTNDINDVGRVLS